jgi:hypothetical protein
VNPVTGRRRRKYGTRQRNNAAAGEPIRLVLNTGEAYSGRITGSHTAFIDYVLAVGVDAKLQNVYSERGTEYGPQPEARAAIPAA